jgi:hypothetical protein
MSILTNKDELLYQNFWQWFQQNEKAFFKVVKNQGNILDDFLDKISPQLAEIKEGFYFLTGMFDDDTVELIISAEGDIKNFVFVEELIAAAPQLSGWRFTALKPASEMEVVMENYRFSTQNIGFFANEHENYPDLIDITILYDDWKDADNSLITNGMYVFLDNYLGELNFALSIDKLKIINTTKAEQAKIPIEKLRDYLIWREKEFIEKYDGVHREEENSKFAILSADLPNGLPLIAVIDMEILHWDKKPSYPWILQVDMEYDGNDNNGLPDKETREVMDDIEDLIQEELSTLQSSIYIGRQTSENLREIYFACKEFRQISKTIFLLQKKLAQQMEFSYDIYKDKYWQSFERFRRT